MGNRFFLAGIVLILVLSCLFYGSVRFYYLAICEVLTGVLMAAWLLEAMVKKRFDLVRGGFWLPVLFFLVVVILQLVPFPLPFIKKLSLSTYKIYRDFLPEGFEPFFFTLSIQRFATLNELFKALTYFAIFFLVVNRIDNKRDIDFLLKAIILLGFCISLWAIIQRFAFPDRVYWFDPPGSAGLPMGPFANRNNFSGYINMIIPLGLGYLLQDISFSRRIILGLATAVMTLALFISYSRAGLIVHMVALIFIGLLLSFRRKLRNKALLVLLWPTLVIVLFLNYFDPRSVFARLATLFSKETFVYLGHGYSWLDILRICRDFPFLGTGLGTFGFISSIYNSNPSQMYFTYAHNDILQLFSEVGVLGGFCVFWFFAIYFFKVVRHWLNRHDRFIIYGVLGGVGALFAILFYSLLDFNLHIPAVALLFAVLLAVVYRLSILPSVGYAQHG